MPGVAARSTSGWLWRVSSVVAALFVCIQPFPLHFLFSFHTHTCELCLTPSWINKPAQFRAKTTQQWTFDKSAGRLDKCEPPKQWTKGNRWAKMAQGKNRWRPPRSSYRKCQSRGGKCRHYIKGAAVDMRLDVLDVEHVVDWGGPTVDFMVLPQAPSLQDCLLRVIQRKRKKTLKPT